MPLTFRRAHPDEAAALTALALRSKRHWRYDEAFMGAALAAMEITPEAIADSIAIVAERDAARVGFYVLGVEPEGPTLRDLWLEPTTIGTGLGAMLWTHIIGEARAAGFRTVRLVSDPHAAGFYARMGAQYVGDVESVAVKGRMLPAFEIEVG